MTDQRTLLVVDGPSLFYRAFYAYANRGDRTPDGRPLWGIAGFLSLFLGIVDMVDPAAIVVGFDDPHTSARRDRYPHYKDGRPEPEEDLVVQLNAVPELLTELGITVIAPPGLEADDVLASAAQQAEAAGWCTVLATSDRDAFGCITNATRVLRLVSGLKNAEWFAAETLHAKYGVWPEQWRDYATMVGDKSDNLPGVYRIGPKTAARLLDGCGSLDVALASRAAADAAIGATMAAKLFTPEAGHAIARNRDIMNPVLDIPVDPNRCRPSAGADKLTATLLRGHLPLLVDRAVHSLAGRVPAPEKPPLDCPMPGCTAQIRMARLANGRFRPVNATPQPAGTLAWFRTSDGWRMRVLRPGEQPVDGRRWTAHTCAGQWTEAA